MRQNSCVIDQVNIVLANEVINGHVVVEAGKIKAIEKGRTTLPSAINGHGGYLMPGFVEIHTDQMDKCFTPRPKTHWPATAAMKLHDSIMALSGITTVCDAIAVGYEFDGGDRAKNLQRMVDALIEGEKNNLHRTQHFLHLRCELPNARTVELFERFSEAEPLRLVSLMDHSPGQRQFANIEKFREYYQGKYNLSDEKMADYEKEQVELSSIWSAKNRANIAEQCQAKQLVLASHDDTTLAHVEEAKSHGCTIAEFPTTIAAAKASHQLNMQVVMGAPNVVRGGSHSGNVAAHDLAAENALDILSSDYYPTSLLDAAFTLSAREDNQYGLSEAINMISKNPAEVLQLTDRGEIAIGKRADLVLASLYQQAPMVESVWSKGRRVH